MFDSNEMPDLCYNDNTPEHPQVDMMTRDWVVQGINRIVNEVE
jgi:hypothetical protein